MRSIDPVLKSACMTGAGIPIASAVITSLATVPLANQSFTVIKYEYHGEELTATLQGAEFPNYGKIVISRGYEVSSIQYVEPTPQFHISKIIETSSGVYEIVANAYPPMDGDVGGSGTVASYMIAQAALFGLTMTFPEQGSANAIVDASAYDITGYYNIKQAFHKVGAWPLVRFYLSETGITAIADPSDTTNISEIAIIEARAIRFYDWIIGRYDGHTTGTYYLSAYLNDASRIQPSVIFTLHFDIGVRVPDIREAIAKYYNERENAHIFSLLADMELEEGDRFSYDGYDWRIETISEKFGNEFTQSLFCLRIGETPVPSYLLLENGDNILFENNDIALME